MERTCFANMRSSFPKSSPLGRTYCVLYTIPFNPPSEGGTVISSMVQVGKLRLRDDQCHVADESQC